MLDSPGSEDRQFSLLWPQISNQDLPIFKYRNNALTMSEAAVVGEGTEVNKGENARMASFVGALAIGEYCPLLPPTHVL